MNKFFLLAGVTSFVATAANAADITPYVSAKLMYSMVKADAVETWQAENYTDKVKEKADDNVLGASFAFGAQTKIAYGALRSELEIALRPTASKKYSDSEWGDNWKNSVTTNTLMLNLYYDIDTGTNITPYVGAGIGFASLKGEFKYNDGAEAEKVSKRKTNLAWSLGAGVAYNLTDHVAVDLGYRYIDMGNVTAKQSYPEYNAMVKHKFDAKAHEVMFGVRYSF